MSDQNVIPVSDAQTRAIEASANTLREAIKALQGLGGYLERVFGTVPEDLVGYFGGDRLKVARAENIVRIVNRSKELNDKRGTTPESVSISLGLPLLVAAADESRDELVDLWARLLAAAADPRRTKHFRIAFIEVAKQMDPLDALVLQRWQLQFQGREGNRVLGPLASTLHVGTDEIAVSIGNLLRLRLAERTPMGENDISAFGREFFRTVSD